MMHPEVLPPIQQACLRQLGPAAEMLGFYMLANAGDVADWACVQATIAGWVRAVAS